MLTTFISKILSGAVVGYITNDLAIQMLFRKRFGLGGIILKTREEFIKNISDLVEREIVNDRTLLKELQTSTESFGLALRQATDDFFEQHIFEAVNKSFKIGDIPQIETSFYKIHADFSDSLPPFVDTSLDYIFKNIDLQKVISENTLRSLTNSGAKILIRSLREDDFLFETFRQFHLEHTDLRPVDLMSESILNQLAQNAAGITEGLHQTLKTHFFEETEETLQKILINLDTDRFFNKLAKQITEKQIGDLLGRQNSEELSGELTKRLQALLHSENGKQLIRNFAEYILESLENEDTTIFELMSEGLAENFDNFLKSQLPVFLERLISWLESRKPRIERLIDTAFRANIKWKFQDWIIEWFIGSVSRHANAVRKIIETVEKHRTDPEETTRALTEQIIIFLKNNTIGSIASRMKTENSLNALTEMLISNADQMLKGLKPVHFEPILNQKIGSFVKAEQIENFLKDNFKSLINNELKEKFLFSPKSDEILGNKAKYEIYRIGQKSLIQILNQKAFEKYARRQSNQMMDTLAENQAVLSGFLYDKAIAKLGNLDLENNTNLQLINSLGDFVTRRSTHFLRTQYELRRGEHLHEYLHRLRNFKSQVPNLVHQGITENLPQLLSNRQVAKVVTSSLNRMDASRLREILEKFMGRELKPITRFGALLGGVAGGFLNFLPVTSGLTLAGTGIAGVAFGITGYATNWLAIKMIFRPYRQKMIPLLGVGVPFTPGVVAKRQPRFAESMGKFVVNGLLNTENLHSTFQQKKAGLKTNALELFASEDYRLIDSFLQKNQTKFSATIAETLSNTIFDDTDKLVDTFEKWLTEKASYRLQENDTKELENQLLEYLSAPQFTENIHREAQQIVRNYAQSERNLNEFITPSVREKIYDRAGVTIGKYLEQLFEEITEKEKVIEILRGFDQTFQKIISARISDYLDDERQEIARNTFSDYLRKTLIDKRLRTIIFDFIEEKFAEQLAPEKQINELLDGRLMRLVADNLDFVVDNLITYSLNFLKENKEKLANEIYRKAYEDDKTSALYKSVIIDTVKELAEKGFPDFFEREKTGLRQLVASGVYEIGESKIGVLNISPDQNQLNKLVENFLDNDEMTLSLTRMTHVLSDEIFNIPISTFVQIADVHRAEDLAILLKDELDLIINHLETKIRTNQTAIGTDTALLLLKVLEERLPQIQLHQLTKGISEKQIDEITGRFIELTFNSQMFQAQKENFVRIAFHKLRSQELSQLTDWESLQTDLSKSIRKIANNPATKLFFCSQIQELIAQNLGKITENLQPETKNFILDKLADSLLNTLEHNLHHLLTSIDLRGLVVSEVNAMSPQQIEDLFNSFAKKYFAQLIRYGFGFGIAFGLVIDLILFGIFQAIDQ